MSNNNSGKNSENAADNAQRERELSGQKQKTTASAAARTRTSFPKETSA